MNMKPWLFRNQALLIEEYPGFANPRSVVLDKLAVWALVHKLPDNFLFDRVVRAMSRSIGEVLDV